MAYRLDLAICDVIVDEEQQYVETRFPDGSKVGATPNFDPEALKMAQELGYGTDTWTMTVDHEIGHCWLAYLQGHLSNTLWVVAHPELETGEEWREEREVLDYQKQINANCVRPWDHLRKPFRWRTR